MSTRSIDEEQNQATNLSFQNVLCLFFYDGTYIKREFKNVESFLSSKAEWEKLVEKSLRAGDSIKTQIHRYKMQLEVMNDKIKKNDTRLSPKCAACWMLNVINLLRLGAIPDDNFNGIQMILSNPSSSQIISLC